MATQTIKMVFQFRRDTAANWEQYKHIVPAAGEPCFVVDKNILKIGDGIKTFEELDPINGVKLEIAADGKSVVLEDNILKLMGFDGAAAGAQPRKNADGNIEWVVPSTETVDGLKITVAGLQSDVTNLQTDVNSLKDIVGSVDVTSGTILSRIEGLETKVDGTGDGTIDAKIDAKINEFANKVTDGDTIDTFKELVDYVSSHGGEVKALVNNITTLQQLVGSTSVSEQIDEAIKNSGHISKSEAEDTLLSKVEAKATLKHVKYEISHKPTGTLVDYRDKEIRVMVKSDTKFELQNSGEGADSNSYYIGFKAYAPDGAVSFKEDLAEIIADNTMYSFDGNKFAGIDAYGRKYSIVWLPVAKFADGSWTYHGAKSSKNKYVGWYYSVEWYGVDGNVIDSDCIRINLSNEQCHNNIEPFYMNSVVRGVKVNGTLIDMVDGMVNVNVPNFKGSDEIEVNEDGTLSIKAISFDKVAQGTTTIVMDGGSAV